MTFEYNFDSINMYYGDNDKTNGAKYKATDASE